MIDREYFNDTRPWKVTSGTVETADGTPIAHMDRETGNGTIPTERDQNAHFIVEACNAYIFPEDRDTLTREEITAELDRVDYALADIRDTLTIYRKDINSTYAQEKLEERDKLLTRHGKLTRKLEKITPQYRNRTGTIEGHRAAMQVLDTETTRRVYRIVIDLENDALQAAGGEIDRFELCTILEGLAERVQAGDMERTVQDTNGNSIGQAEIIETSAQ